MWYKLCLKLLPAEYAILILGHKPIFCNPQMEHFMEHVLLLVY